MISSLRKISSTYAVRYKACNTEKDTDSYYENHWLDFIWNLDNHLTYKHGIRIYDDYHLSIVHVHECRKDIKYSTEDEKKFVVKIGQHPQQKNTYDLV